MAQEISAQSTKPNEHGQENLNWKKTSRIKLLSKIIFKICVSKLQQESIGKSRSQLSYTEASFQTKQEFMCVLLFIAKAVLLKKDIWTVIKGWCGGSRKFKTDQTIYGRQVYQWLVNMMMQSSEISGLGNSHILWLPEVRKSYTCSISSSLSTSILYSSTKGNWGRWATGANKTSSSFFLFSEQIIKTSLVMVPSAMNFLMSHGSKFHDNRPSLDFPKIHSGSNFTLIN